MTQSVGRVMREQGGGVIINLISPVPGVSEAGRDESLMRAAFFASMAGLETFSQQAALELAPYGVRIHALKTNTNVETILELCRSAA